MNLLKCARCHSEMLEDFFSKNRKGEFKKTCDRCCSTANKKVFQCDKCDYKGSNNSHLQQHIKSIHDKMHQEI